jgi:hypothetical protein
LFSFCGNHRVKTWITLAAPKSNRILRDPTVGDEEAMLLKTGQTPSDAIR